MKFFFSTKFIEGFKKPIGWLPTIRRFNESYRFVHLVSVGVVCEDGREYYAISKEFNPNDANDWFKQTVLVPLQKNNVPETISCQTHTKKLVQFKIKNAKSNSQIASEICEFIDARYIDFSDPGKGYIQPSGKTTVMEVVTTDLELYSYYAEWESFYSLFGTKKNLPKGFPIYCRSLKQMFDERAQEIYPSVSADTSFLTLALDYPKNSDQHNALSCAKWNFELYKFLRNNVK